jgi:hypothetical protein
MKKRILILGIIGLIVSLFVPEVSVPSPWGRSEIPLISTGLFMLIIYGLVAKDHPKK